MYNSLAILVPPAIGSGRFHAEVVKDHLQKLITFSHLELVVSRVVE